VLISAAALERSPDVPCLIAFPSTAAASRPYAASGRGFVTSS